MSLNTEELHLLDYWRIVKKRHRLILFVFLAGFLSVVLVGLSMTPIYEGTTRVLIEKVANADTLDKYYGSGYDPLFYETQFQLIKSDAVGRRVAKGLNADEHTAILAGGATSGVRAWLTRVVSLVKRGFSGSGIDPATLDEEDKLDLMAHLVSGNIEISPANRSRIVEIGYRSANPVLAARVANSVAQAYVEETLEMKLDFTRLTLDWMTRKAEEEASKVEDSESRLQRYMVENNILSMEDEGAVTPEQLNQLSSEMVSAESQRKDLETLYARARQAYDNPALAETLPAIAREPSVQTLRSQILEAEQHILELSSEYGPKHPTMKKAVSDLDSLENKKILEIQRIIASIGSELELAKSRESSLRAQFARTQEEVLSLGQKYVQYSALKREVETSRQLYDALMLKIKEQGITQDTQPVNVWIIERATIPEFAVAPDKRKIFLGGFAGCLILGLALAFFIEYLDNTVRYPDEAERKLGISVLGQVSLWAEDSGTVENAVQTSPRSAFAESYKAMRAAIVLSRPDHQPGKIMITSPGPGAGKTTTAVNLAMAMAQAEKRVLLIDGDLRKPRIHKIYGKSNQTGLSSFLAGDSGKNLLKQGPMENLTLITSGPIPPNPSELLSSQRFRSMLEELTKDYDVILCDTPPLMSVADARSMSTLFDGTILVVRAHQTPFDLARKAIKSLTDINAPLLGMVINALDLKKGDYYYNYYHYSAYGEEPAEETVKG